ncbi:hypothetical protein ACHAWF_015615, partial [Thalassiosira exigua]
MVAKRIATRTIGTTARSPELRPTRIKNEQTQQWEHQSHYHNQKRPQQKQQQQQQQQSRQQTRGGVLSPGHVKQKAQVPGGAKNDAPLTGDMKMKNSLTSCTVAVNIAKTPTTSNLSESTHSGFMADRYGIPTKNASSSAKQTEYIRKIRTAMDAISPIPSLLSEDSISFDADEAKLMETDLYQKFEEAFNITLRDNPGILPGAPTVVESIKSALFKVQKIKAQREYEMRRRVDEVKKERAQLEAELNKEMGTTSLRNKELRKELELAKSGRDALQESLIKQKNAISAVKRELTLKMSEATSEKEELTKHLRYLSKSRAELEKALEQEMNLAEKERNELQKVVAERKRLKKQKMENKELERQIEAMTHSASNEKKALQAEVADVQRFQEHIAQLKRQNEEAHKSLEEEKVRLKELADEMQTKKIALKESTSDMEMQYRKEIDELQRKMNSTKLMNEREMEKLVKRRVISYLREGRDGSRRDCFADTPEIEREIGEGGVDRDSMNTTQCESQRREADLHKREAELNSRLHGIERLLKSGINSVKESNGAKKNNSSTQTDILRGDSKSFDLTESDDILKMSKQSQKELRREATKMKREIENLRGEIEHVRSDDIREEIRCLRDEIKRGHQTPKAPATPGPSRGRFMSPDRLPISSMDDTRDEIKGIRDDLHFLRKEIKSSHHTPGTHRGRGRFMSPGRPVRPQPAYADGQDYSSYDAEDNDIRVGTRSPPLQSARSRFMSPDRGGRRSLARYDESPYYDDDDD